MMFNIVILTTLILTLKVPKILPTLQKIDLKSNSVIFSLLLPLMLESPIMNNSNLKIQNGFRGKMRKKSQGF